jgi:hypothetical protein
MMANVLAVLLALLFGCLGFAKILASPFARERAAHLRFSVLAYRFIGMAEACGAAALAAGIWWPVLGILAASCLLLLLGGALVAHLRNGDGPRMYTPAVAAAVVVGIYLAAALGRV